MTEPAGLAVVRCDAIDGLSPMQDGRAHQVDVVRVRSDLFREPVIVTSDLHKDALLVFEHLTGKLQSPAEWHVITCGDMAGTAKWGEDATPLPVLQFILESFRSLHCVHGNHDTVSEDILSLSNTGGEPCCLDERPCEMAGRRICGVSGIMGLRRRPGSALLRTLSPGAGCHRGAWQPVRQRRWPRPPDGACLIPRLTSRGRSSSLKPCGGITRFRLRRWDHPRFPDP
jgi:hypothetical protein